MVELTGPQFCAFASFVGAFSLGMAAGAMAGVIPIWSWNPFGIPTEVQMVGVSLLFGLAGVLFTYIDTRLE